MLVTVVKCVDPIERVIPSLVWLETFDRLNSLIPHSLYFSLKSGFVGFGTEVPFEDWERRVFGGGAVVRNDESLRQVIQRGSEILNSISDDGADRAGNRCSLLHDVNDLVGLEVCLSDNFIRVRTDKLLQGNTTILDVLIGPLDL